MARFALQKQQPAVPCTVVLHTAEDAHSPPLYSTMNPWLFSQTSCLSFLHLGQVPLLSFSCHTESSAWLRCNIGPEISQVLANFGKVLPDKGLTCFKPPSRGESCSSQTAAGCTSLPDHIRSSQVTSNRIPVFLMPLWERMFLICISCNLS